MLFPVMALFYISKNAPAQRGPKWLERLLAVIETAIFVNFLPFLVIVSIPKGVRHFTWWWSVRKKIPAVGSGGTSASASLTG